MHRPASFLPFLFFMIAAASFASALIPADHRAVESLIDMRHLAAFALLGFLAALSWPRATAAGVTGLLLLGMSIELAQLMPHLKRNASLGDLASDLIGIAVGYSLAASLLNRAASGGRQA